MECCLFVLCMHSWLMLDCVQVRSAAWLRMNLHVALQWHQRRPAHVTCLAVFNGQVKGHRSPFGGWGACCTEDLIDLCIPDYSFSEKLCCMAIDLTWPLALHVASCQHLGQISLVGHGLSKLLPPLTFLGIC